MSWFSRALRFPDTYFPAEISLFASESRVNLSPTFADWTPHRTWRGRQRGFFAQVKYKIATLGAYVFNPDDSDSRFAVFSLGAEF